MRIKTRLNTFLRTVLLFALLGSAATATAYDFMVDGIYYNINGNEATVTSGTNEDTGERTISESYAGEVTIPESVIYQGTTYPVTAIGYGAFQESAITSIDIPGSVRSIGIKAFCECHELRRAVIGEGCDTIYSGAFYLCDNLYDLVIPNSVVFIGEQVNNFSAWGDGSDAFHGTPWFDNQPDGVVYAGRCVYVYKGDKSNLTTLSLKPGTTCIPNRTFGECSNLTSVDIPNSVTYIGIEAFYGCYSLKNVSIGSQCAMIGNLAFAGEGYDGLPITSVTCKAAVPPVKISSANDIHGLFISWRFGWDDIKQYYGVYNNATLYVPLGSVEAYKNADDWCQFKNIVGVNFPDAPDLPADLNGDGEVNIADVNLVINAILNDDQPSEYDIDGDGEVGIADVVALIDIMLGF